MRIVSLILISFFLCSFSFADSTHSTKNAKDPLLLANAPPGLHKKGFSGTPSFLGKTPPGWKQGLKKGWNKDRNWEWNKNTNFWQNKHWKWDTKTNGWKKTKSWDK